jgi:hypothetical protein
LAVFEILNTCTIPISEAVCKNSFQQVLDLLNQVPALNDAFRNECFRILMLPMNFSRISAK